MNLLSSLAEYEARDYLAFREVIDFCIRHNCDYIEDAFCLRIVSKFSGYVWAIAPSFVETRVDTPHVALLRALVDNLVSLHEHDSLVQDSTVRELFFNSVA